MKNKIVFKSKKEIVSWISIANLLAKSRISHIEALKQFNALSAIQRTKIKMAFDEYDEIRRKNIPAGEMNSNWEISVMVDAHIIATENNIDPLTALMCINPICKKNE